MISKCSRPTVAFHGGLSLRHGVKSKTPVKVNLELGRSLREQLERDALASCRRLSWQVEYYVQKSIESWPPIHAPGDTLDDTGGRFTVYLPEGQFQYISDFSESGGHSLSAVLRAAILHGMAICREVPGNE